jgi:hypothetical protein
LRYEVGLLAVALSVLVASVQCQELPEQIELSWKATYEKAKMAALEEKNGLLMEREKHNGMMRDCAINYVCSLYASAHVYADNAMLSTAVC